MISLRKVTKSYGSVSALVDLSLDIAEGESVLLAGPSGSGKTTLLRIVAGLESLDRGEVRIGDRSASTVDRLTSPVDRGIGFAFQRPALWPHMTVEQNIRFGLGGLRAAQARARVAELLEAVSLTGLAGRYPEELSGGEARRVGLARALAPRPRILLLDEPLSQLDDQLQQRILPLILRSARETRAAMIYVTHDTMEAERAGLPMTVLEHGRLVGDDR